MVVKLSLQFVQSHRFGTFGTSRLLSILSSCKLQNRRRDALARTEKGTCFFSSSAEALVFEADELRDEVETTEKDTALRMALTQLAGDFSKESMLSLQRFFGARRTSVISTGSLKLDLALGVGGLPKGRIVEIFGQEASGKTTLALHIIKEAQKLGGYCAYLDVENALDPSLAESIGVNTENLLISQPDSAENLLSVVDTLTKSGSVDVIVVDSVAALVPQHELDFMVRSHLRSGQGIGHTDEVTCGGNALQFYSAIRLRMIRKELLKSKDKVTGLGIRIKVVKNKLAPAMRTAELEIQFGRGFCSESEVLELACEHEVILKEGNNYFIDGNVLNNRLEAESYLAKNDEVLDKIVKSLRNHLFQIVK